MINCTRLPLPHSQCVLLQGPLVVIAAPVVSMQSRCVQLVIVVLVSAGRCPVSRAAAAAAAHLQLQIARVTRRLRVQLGVQRFLRLHVRVVVLHWQIDGVPMRRQRERRSRNNTWCTAAAP